MTAETAAVRAVYFPQAPLGRVPPHGVAMLFARNKRNTTAKAVLFVVSSSGMRASSRYGDNRHIRIRKALSRRKYSGNLIVGTNGVQHEALDAEALTTFCTTPCEDSATTLGSHARAETVALSTLALVGLIGTFHCNSFVV